MGLGRFSRRKVVMYVIALSAITILSFLILWLGAQLFHYEVEYYEPRDQERERLYEP